MTVEPDEPVWLKAGDLIGTIVDDRHYEISVSASGPLLAEIPQDQLLVLLQDSQTGKLIPGEYARTDEVDNGREITRNFVFTIREDSAESARLAQQVLTQMAANAAIQEQMPVTFVGGQGYYLAAVAGNRTILQFLRVLPGGTFIQLVAVGETQAMTDAADAVRQIAASVDLR